MSRISRWEDRNNDGVYETHTVFVDSLVFPRFATPYGADAVLTMESNSNDVYKYTDTNGDGRADRKELFTTNFGRLANVEHLQSSLFWSMDNWLYSTVNQFRVRETPTGVIREPTGFNDAQWGATQDDDGKQWFQNGWLGVPATSSSRSSTATFSEPNRYETDFDEIFGAPIGLADMQGGMPVVRKPDGSLARGTAGSGANVYRGGRLPHDLLGDYFYGEVVGRVVRRVRPIDEEGLTPRPQRLSAGEVGVHPLDRSALPSRRDQVGARRLDVRRGHVPRHHPGEPVDAEGLVRARQDRAVQARQDRRARPHLAHHARRRRSATRRARAC